MKAEAKINVYKTAKTLIASFTKREKQTYEYILELLKNDFKAFQDIDIALRAGDDQHKVEIGIHKVYHAHDRAKFILNTLGLHANIFGDEIVITTIA